VGFCVQVHNPVLGLHVPDPVWHWSAGPHVTVLVGWHAPLTHRSPTVQALLSEQVAPSGATGFEHPVDTLQVPAR
jgi:hypothetical protein